MLEMLLVAGLSGLVIGALMLGKIISQQSAFTRQQKALGNSIKALHARFDVLVLAFSGKGLIDAGIMADLMRHESRED